MSSEDTRKAIEGWATKRAYDINKRASDRIGEIAEDAKRELKRELEGLKTQAEAFDSVLPFNLIDIITKGGFVKAKEITIDYRSELMVNLGGYGDIFSQDLGTRSHLYKGRYKIVVIVEKLEDEP